MEFTTQLLYLIILQTQAMISLYSQRPHRPAALHTFQRQAKAWPANWCSGSLVHIVGKKKKMSHGRAGWYVSGLQKCSASNTFLTTHGVWTEPLAAPLRAHLSVDTQSVFLEHVLSHILSGKDQAKLATQLITHASYVALDRPWIILAVQEILYFYVI